METKGVLYDSRMSRKAAHSPLGAETGSPSPYQLRSASTDSGSRSAGQGAEGSKDPPASHADRRTSNEFELEKPGVSSPAYPTAATHPCMQNRWQQSLCCQLILPKEDMTCKKEGAASTIAVRPRPLEMQTCQDEASSGLRRDGGNGRDHGLHRQPHRRARGASFDVVQVRGGRGHHNLWNIRAGSNATIVGAISATIVLSTSALQLCAHIRSIRRALGALPMPALDALPVGDDGAILAQHCLVRAIVGRLP